MRDGIAAGLARAGIDELDLIYHAACLLSNYETASALAPLSKTMAGSEEIMTLYPVSPAGLVPLAEDADGVEVAKALVDGYRALLEDPEVGLGAGNRELMAMSVVDSEPMSRLDAALEAFADAVVPRMDELAPDVARARARTLEFARPFGYDGFNLVDLGDFLRQLDEPAGRGRGRPQRGLRGAAGCRAVPGDRPWHRADDRPQRLLPDRPRGRSATTSPTGRRRPAGRGSSSAFLGAAQSAPDGQVAFAEETPDVLEEGPAGIKIQGRIASGEASLGGHLRADAGWVTATGRTRSSSRATSTPGARRTSRASGTTRG